jgi:hypothetical protein
MGAIRTCMGEVSAMNIRELQQTELIIAPSIKTEGKVFQRAQKLGGIQGPGSAAHVQRGGLRHRAEPLPRGRERPMLLVIGRHH